MYDQPIKKIDFCHYPRVSTGDLPLTKKPVDSGYEIGSRQETSDRISWAMKELVDRYRPVRQRTVHSETTKDRTGALPPAVYSSQPSCRKMIFHEDAQDHSVTENQEEIEQNMPPVAVHDHNVTGVTFVDDNEVAVVAICEMTDLPVQEDNMTPTQRAIGRMIPHLT